MKLLYPLFVPTAITAVGIYLLIRLRAFPYLHPIRTLRIMLGGDTRSSLSALMLALSGTLGVGNITGVALALFSGGAGAVFWMWVSAALAMPVRYAEVALALDGKRPGKLHTLCQFFMPANKIGELQEREGVPYQLYVSMGLIKPSGENYVDYNDCFEWFRMLVEEYEILPLQVGYDRYSAQYLVQQMEQYGFHMDDVYQGENLTPVIHECDGLLRDQTLQLGTNNLLKAHFLNVGMKQNEETRKIRPVKIDPRCHIDGFVAVIDALTVRQKHYETIGEQLRNDD